MNSTSRIVISVIIIVLIAAVVGWIWFAANQAEEATTPSPSPTPTQLVQQSSPSGSTTEDQQADSGIVKEIEVTNQGLDFAPKTITVNRGDVVRIIYTSVGDTHTFTLPEFNVDTGNVDAGDQATVEFVAAEPGSFEFYCTPHRSMGMTGTLVVK